jgi:hypothetical protein
MDETTEHRPEEPAREGTRAYPTYHPFPEIREPLLRNHRLELAEEQKALWLRGGTP